MSLTMEVLQKFLDKPVAVQLRLPILVIDNDGKAQNRIEHAGHVYGFPQIVTDPQGRAAASPVLVGVLSVAESAAALLMKSKGENGAVILTTLELEQIQHVFLITQPGDGPSMIQVP